MGQQGYGESNNPAIKNFGQPQLWAWRPADLFYTSSCSESPLKSLIQLTIMSSINRSVRTASRTLRIPILQSRALRAPLAISSRANFAAPNRTSSFRQFSAMSPLQSGAPPPPQAREYDPEIKDIASYVHNTPINSDLAVSFPRLFPRVWWPCWCSGLVWHREICFPRHSRMWSWRSAI